MSLVRDIIERLLFPNRELHIIPVLDGAFAPNNGLDQGRALGGEIEAPDDFATGPDGALYVSSGKTIVRCAGDDYSERTPFVKFESPVGGLAWSPDGHLLACVSGRGLFALTAGGEVRGRLETVEGAPLDCPTAVAVATDGTIYVTDGSRHNLPERWLHDLMQNRPGSGRLISCDRHLSNARVRADGLSWPLGVVVSHEEDEVWVSEAWAHRLTAISRAGGKRVLVKNFAGYPARLARGTAGDYWLAFFALRTQLTEFVLRERRFCDEMMERVPPELWIGPSLDGRFNYREPTQIGRIKKLGIEKPWAPARSYGLVARIGGSGEAVESLHSRVGGQMHGIMTVRRIGSRVIAASKGHNVLVGLPVPGQQSTGE